ncbi:MAG TPA: sensor histidine kinase, partial [Ohtaekwangia sp.]|nr:sensor histidine kinase [Ohtaekwangia sp.]
LVNKVLGVVLHLCGWALFFMLPFRFISKGTLISTKDIAPLPGQMSPLPPAHPMMVRMETIWSYSLMTNGLLAAFFYINMFVLIPKILTRKGWMPYIFVIAAVLAVYLITGYVLRQQYIGVARPFNPPVFVGIPNFFMVFGLSLALRLVQDRSVYERTLKERETEKLKSELLFLRSQVSPHFMFNILNSLASLARKKSGKVESAIIQLSQLMRYSLYHTDKRVTLEQEAEYLRNYINLQKLRFGGTVSMYFHVDIAAKDVEIEPMLLAPFVENAFKHGIGLIPDPVIVVILEASANRISFTVRNKFNPVHNEIKDFTPRIGLSNVRRRLDLLYKDRYTMDTYTAEEQWFVTELKIIPT